MIKIITLFDDTKYEFNFYRTIPTHMYPNIRELKCNNCDLDDIDFISLFPNLKKINASNNKIKTIPIVSNIEELDIYNNQLIELPPLINLKKLYAFNNKLIYLPLYPKLEIIDVSHNNIITLLFGENINKIDISYNQIIDIEFQGNNVIDLNCSYNYLQNINFIHGLNKINNINYEYNPIKILPIHIIRHLQKPSNIYNNDDNYHNYHNLDKLTINKILNIINRFNNINTDAYNIIVSYLYKKKFITLPVIDILNECINITVMEPTIKLTYLELFICYMNYIMINDIHKYKKLNHIILLKGCKCISCLFKNLSAIL